MRECRQFLFLLATAGLVVHAPAAPGAYADEKSCARCHADKVAAYATSAHALTTSWPGAGNMQGNFAPGANTMETIDPNLTFLMEKIGADHFQTARLTTPTQTMQRRERIDIIVGSGRKAQTYLYWDGDLLRELPVSYWMRTGTWMNSPGYPDGTANFDRGTSDRCLECHATSFVTRPPPRNRFDPASLVLGISCQKCHGPAADHVARRQAGLAPGIDDLGYREPGEVTPSTADGRMRALPRGRRQTAGTNAELHRGRVSREVHRAGAGRSGKPADPHGSQWQTLTQSRCYQESQRMTCLTCHDVHQTQRRAETYTQSCLKCHQPEACGQFAVQRDAIRDKCIDCHMPLKTTAKIVMRLAGERHQPQVRTHRIGIPNKSAD